MRKIGALALASTAVLLTGCAFAHKAIPLDASGMEYPLNLAKAHLAQQVDLTRESITGLPRAISEHCQECWRNLTRDPSDL